MTTELSAREAPARYVVDAHPAIRKGYKQTEVGVIPEDWNVELLSTVTNLITCGIAATPKYVGESRGYPFLSSTNVKNGMIRWLDYKYIDATLHRQLYRNNPPKRGDILYSRVGTIGEAAVIDVDFEFSIYVSLTLIKPKALLDNSFLMHLLNSAPYKQRAKDQVYLGGGVGNLNVDVVRRYPIPIPPTKTEQEAIAEALSDADALIAALEQLIAKKRQLKQGAMQELLTGKKRLPGFAEEWEEKQIGEVADMLKGSGLSKNAVTASGQRKCILYGELFTTYGQVIHDAIGRTDSKDGRLSVWGDVLVPGSTTTDGIDLATASTLLEDGVALGGDINIIRFRDVNSLDPIFIANYLTNVKKHEIAERAQGTTIVHLYGRDLSDLSVQWPSFAEQTAIATTLSDMDTEIAALETRLTKARGIKQGMMQELLTGRIRLV